MTDPTTAAPKVTGAPDTIWLVYGELEHDDTHAALVRADDAVTWCEDRQFPSDVKYVRAELAPPAAPQGEDRAAFEALENLTETFGAWRNAQGEYESIWMEWGWKVYQAALTAERAKPTEADQAEASAIAKELYALRCTTANTYGSDTLWRAARLLTLMGRAKSIAVLADAEVLERLAIEIEAIPCRHHGSPSYDHDAYWFKSKAVQLIDKHIDAARHPQAGEQTAAPQHKGT